MARARAIVELSEKPCRPVDFCPDAVLRNTLSMVSESFSDRDEIRVDR